MVPTNTGGMLMHPHNRRVDHLDGNIMSGSNSVHEPAPYTSPSPANEAVMTGSIGAVAFRQIAPRRAGSQHPEDAVEDPSIVGTGYASRLVWQHRLDGRPFIIREFVPYDSRPQF